MKKQWLGFLFIFVCLVVAGVETRAQMDSFSDTTSSDRMSSGAMKAGSGSSRESGRTVYSMKGYEKAFGKGNADLAPPHYEEGSLWSESSNFNSPFEFESFPEFKIGDIVTVVVKENFETREDLRVQNEVESDLTFNITRLWSNELERQLFGRIPGSNGTIDFPKADIKGTDDYDAQSRGRQRSQLTIEIPCTVRKILPDGRLLIEGRSSRVIGRDRKHYLLSGTVRPEDIDPDKRTVPSTRVADSQIRWEGKGPNQDTLKPGLVNRILDYIPLF